MGSLASVIFLISVVALLVLLLVRQQFRLKKLEKLLAHNNERLEKLHVDFGRFAPQEVIEHLTAGEEEYTPSMRSVTVLFADIKGFTKLCDSMEPQVVVSILNGYFQCMTRALSKHHGEVTEMMGDGLLALFGAINSNPWQVQDAVQGAIAMREALKEYNVNLKAESLPELSIGIGIHQGEVLAGIMGNYELSKFGVVGDTINVASRVEGLTRVHDVDLLITEEVKAKLDDRFRVKQMPASEVKGKEEPIVTFLVISDK
jgi:adenylate cyclase